MALSTDSDTAQHNLERLKQLTDQKGRAETRIRYRFVADEKTRAANVAEPNSSQPATRSE